MMTLNASMEKSRIKVTIQCDVNAAQDDLWALTLSHQISSEKDANFALEKPDAQHFRVSGNSWVLAISGEPGNVLGSADI